MYADDCFNLKWPKALQTTAHLQKDNGGFMQKSDFKVFLLLFSALLFVGIASTLADSAPTTPFEESPRDAVLERGAKNLSIDLSLAPGDPVDFDAAMEAGADYLQATQADVTDDNAGNGTDGVDETPDDPDDGGWDWRLTSPPDPFAHSTAASPTNIYGATAMGLYYAYLETGDAGYFTALTDAANAMKDNANIKSASDLEFLMLYNDLPGVSGTAYADAARAKYDALIATYGTATAFAEYIRYVRGVDQGYKNGIIAWDIGKYVKAAAMLHDRYPGNGYDSDADDMAEVIYQDSFNDNPGYFDIVDDAGFDPNYSNNNFWWYTLGITGLIDAFSFADVHTTEIPGLLTILMDCMYTNGAISYCYGANADDEDWQSTAYAAITLGLYDQATYQDEINRMGYWLGATQDVSGGWLYSSGNHYPEIGGECTAALYFTDNTLTNVIVDDDFTSQADVDAYNTANNTNYVWGYDAFGNIQDAIDAVNGSTLTVLAGYYATALNISIDNLNLVGAGEASVTIDAGGLAGYNNAGIYVSGNNVSLSGFTLVGEPSTSAPRYGLKYGAVTGGSISNIIVKEFYRTGIDMLGTDGLTLTDVQAIDNGGNGIQTADGRNLTFTNITTSGNAWGGVGIFTWGQYTPIGVYGIQFTGTNSFGESATDNGGLYLEEGNYSNPSSPYPITWSTNPADGADVTLLAGDFLYVMKGDSDNSNDYTRFYATLADALSALAGSPGHITTNRTLNHIDDLNTFLVYDVAPGFMTIQAAVDAAAPGDIVDVNPGTYNESVTITSPVEVLGQTGAQLDGTGLGLVTGVSIKSGNVTWDNLDVLNFGGNGIIVGYETTPPGNLQNVQITNCAVGNIQPGSSHGFGIYCGYEAEGFGNGNLTTHLDYSGLLISGNEIYNTANAALVLQSITSSSGTLDVLNNHMHDADASGIWVDCARNLLIDGNTMEDNSNGIFMSAIADGWYVVDGAYGPKDIDITNNDILNNTDNGVILYAGWPSSIDINLNNIYGNGTDANNTLASPMNAEQNYWGVISAPAVGALMSGDVDYDPWCADMAHTVCTLTDPVSEVWVDDDWAGSSPGDLVGGHVFGYDAFASIQDGVDAVNGSTVNVAAGTYVEQIYIDKTIDLVGAGIGASIIEAVPVGSRTTYNITQWTSDVRTIDACIGVNDAGMVNISGFTVDGKELGPDNFYGIHYFNTDGSVTSCRIEDITDAAHPSYSRVVSLAATHGDGETITIDFSNNEVPNFQKGGILVMGPGATFTVNENSVSGVVSSSIAGNCIQLSYGASGSTYQNVVEGTVYTGTDWASTGILLFESGDVSMDGDEVYNCESGINFSDWGWVHLHPNPVNLTVTNLNLHDNEFALGAQLSRDNSDLNFTITNSVFTNNTGDAIDAWGSDVDPWGGSYYTGWDNGDMVLDVSGCTISGSTLDGIWTADLSGNANNATLNVNGNAFSGNVSSAVNNTMTHMMDATANWWDDVTGPSIGTKSAGNMVKANLIQKPYGIDLPEGDVSITKTTYADKGTGETIYGPVDYSPWWGANYVGDAHASPWQWYMDNSNNSTIQEGIDAASAGDFLNIVDGLYLTDGANVDKALTISGLSRSGVIVGPANAYIEGTNNNGAFFIKSGDVTIKTLTIDGQANTALASGVNNFRTAITTDNVANYSNIDLDDMTIQNIGRRAVQIHNPVAPGTDGHSLTNCTIQNVDQYGCFSSWYAEVTITDNTFIPGANRAIQNVYSHAEIHDNVIDASNTTFGIVTYSNGADMVNGRGTMNCTGNTITGAYWAMAYQGDGTCYNNDITVEGTDGVGIFVAGDHYPIPNDVEIKGNTITLNGDGAYGMNLVDHIDGNLIGGPNPADRNTITVGTSKDDGEPYEPVGRFVNIGGPDGKLPEPVGDKNTGSQNVGIVVWWCPSGNQITIQNNLIECNGGTNSGMLLYHNEQTSAPIVLDNEIITTGATSSVQTEGVGILVTDFGDFFGETGGGGDSYAEIEGNLIRGFVNGIYFYQNHGDNVGGTVTANLLTQNTNGLINEGGVISVTNNDFLNTNNTSDNTSGNTWNANCYSDYSGSGSYAIPGGGGNVDNNPSTDCTLDMTPDQIVYYCTGTLEFQMEISPAVVGMKSGTFTFKFPASLDTVPGGITALAPNAALLPSIYYDNATGYDSLKVSIFNNQASDTYDGPLALFSVELQGSDDICPGDQISVIYADLRDLNNVPIPAPLSEPIDLYVDCTDPVFSTTTADGGWYNTPPVLDISANDNCDIDAVYFQVDGCTPSGWTAITGPGYVGSAYADAAWALPTTVFDGLADETEHCLYFKVIDDAGRGNADSCTYEWCFTKDVTAPAAPTDFVVKPGHEKCKLSWNNPTGDATFAGIEIRRNPWATGAYPEYDDDFAPIGYPADETQGDLVVQTTLESYKDSADLASFPRNVYYYTVFAYDNAGNYSVATSAQQGRATNYWLGDFAAPYDGSVYFNDLLAFSNTYGRSQGDAGYNNECDIGPTDDNPVFGIPQTDNTIFFEDLAIFAIAFDSVSSSLKARPVFSVNPGITETGFRIETRVEKKDLFVDLYLDNGSGLAKSVLAELSFDADRLKLVSTHQSYELANAKQPVFFKALDSRGHVSVSSAVVGNGASFEGSGLLATLQFEISGNQDITIAISNADIRDNENNKLLKDGFVFEQTISAAAMPDKYTLEQNHPNPFNPETEIAFGIPVETRVRLTVYNITGQVVTTLVDEVLPAGRHTVRWNGTDSYGSEVASGIYLYRIETVEFHKTAKMMLVK